MKHIPQLFPIPFFKPTEMLSHHDLLTGKNLSSKPTKEMSDHARSILLAFWLGNQNATRSEESLPPCP